MVLGSSAKFLSNNFNIKAWTSGIFGTTIREEFINIWMTIKSSEWVLFYLEIIDAFQIGKVIWVHETAAVYIVFAGHWGPSNTAGILLPSRLQTVYGFPASFPRSGSHSGFRSDPFIGQCIASISTRCGSSPWPFTSDLLTCLEWGDEAVLLLREWQGLFQEGDAFSSPLVIDWLRFSADE